MSLATWRRWQDDPDAVSANTRTKCERVLDAEGAVQERRRQALRDEYEKIERQWKDHPFLTPRQAAIQTQLDMWQHLYLGEWLEHGGADVEPLHAVSPFDSLDSRVMVHVNDDKAWAHLARQRCIAVRDEMDGGALPFDRDRCFFDEVLMALALAWVIETYEDNEAEGDFDGIAPHADDDDWEVLSDAFECRLLARLGHFHHGRSPTIARRAGPASSIHLVRCAGDATGPRCSSRP
jgi:hypothetical protein